MAKSNRWVYFFGGGKADGNGKQRELLGGKGAGLAEMTLIGLPVPGGFTITTEACAAYHKDDSDWPTGMEKEVRANVTKLEKLCKKKLGDPKDPLLVSVRSGAARSMPGMMETILNLGLNDESVEGLAKVANNRRFAFDAYRRFIMMYGTTAKGVDREHFDEAFDAIKESRTRSRIEKPSDQKVLDTDVSAEEFEELVLRYKGIYAEHAREQFPQDPFEQLRGAINAVFMSWMSEKAKTYRRVERITGLTGTAVNVCQMVFGNMGDDSGTGVCFTRDPSTGDCEFYGDLLINAQGEDVVAGIRTPVPLDNLSQLMPEVYEQLEAVRVMLEVHYKDMQDLEFTIERGKLYMLQCRNGKRSPSAAFKIAVDMATMGPMSPAEASDLVRKKLLPKKYATAASKPIITKEDAINRITQNDIERLFSPIIDSKVSESDLAARRMGSGIGAVPGAATGSVVFSADRAEERAAEGEQVILVRRETSPEDVGGMHAAMGILTAAGGKTSHAAVVARGWGKCCIVGCDELRIDYAAKSMSIGGRVIKEGDDVTLDGTTGAIYEGRIKLERPTAPKEYNTLLKWCDERRRMRVRTNADTPADALKAIEFGAEGIGLCRTEHMFFDAAQPQRLRAMREMILADSEQTRRHALDKLLPFQRKDFEEIFEVMKGKPVTIRLLDPPLHEFLPQADNDEALREIADELAAQGETGGDSDGNGGVAVAVKPSTVTVADLRQRVERLHESNPMLGHRGCRLCITFPEILEMQVRAITEAAVACRKRGIEVLPEIMIPLSIDDKELDLLVQRTRAVADEIIGAGGVKLNYLVGTMVETPRAALLSERLATVSEFFSFGTNDLTQMTMGLSRDDAGRFLPDYIDEEKSGILPCDPFQSVDIDGVGMLVAMSVAAGRSANPRIKLGVCGEHGGDAQSIHFFHAVGLDYVSCSPFRVPVARLAAAQAEISDSDGSKGRARGPARGSTRTSPGGGSGSGRSRTSTAGRSAKKTKSTAGKKSTAKKKTTKRKAAKKNPTRKKTKAKKKSASAKRPRTAAKKKTSKKSRKRR